MIRFGILTVSDRASKGDYEDKSGDGLKKYIEEFKLGVVAERSIVPDEVTEIQKILVRWCDFFLVDVILTTGGTGFAARDVTPEATKFVLEKEAIGLTIAMMQGSLQVTPLAVLSRPICGIRKKSILINLPGSAKGSLENFKFISSALKHAVDLLRDNTNDVDAQHKKMNSTEKLKTQVNAISVADRSRKSPFKTIEVQLAQSLVLQECTLSETIQKTLGTGLGYILAEDVFAKDPLPPFPASIKDGYAVKVSLSMDLLEVTSDSTAGESPEKCQVVEGKCVRVSTGAPVPKGSDAVVQIEDTELVEKTEDGNDEKIIRILKVPKVGLDIRPIGSDIAENERVLTEGARLGPTELGVLATVGVNQFRVYKKPIIAILSTGNELVDPDSNNLLQSGKIRDSNKTTLKALLASEGLNTIDIGVARDTPQELLDKLIEGFNKADIIVSTGGVSMGEKDYLKRVLKTDLGATIHFGSVLMKPGKPTTFATCIFNGVKKLIFGLPGNPVSATVTSLLFVIPACKKLSGYQNPFHTIIQTKLGKDVKLDPTRPEYHRVTLEWSTEDGIPLAHSTGNQISSRLLSCNTANALLMLPQGTSENNNMLRAGINVRAMLFS